MKWKTKPVKIAMSYKRKNRGPPASCLKITTSGKTKPVQLPGCTFFWSEDMIFVRKVWPNAWKSIYMILYDMNKNLSISLTKNQTETTKKENNQQKTKIKNENRKSKSNNGTMVKSVSFSSASKSNPEVTVCSGKINREKMQPPSGTWSTIWFQRMQPRKKSAVNITSSVNWRVEGCMSTSNKRFMFKSRRTFPPNSQGGVS